MFSSDIGGTSFTLRRDCPAFLAPQGDPAMLPAGESGYVMQAFADHFLVYVQGRLFKIATANLDALDRSPPKPPAMPENAGDATGAIPASAARSVSAPGRAAAATGTGRDDVTLQRDCVAVRVPQGESVTLRRGQSGYLTQALGGSFTIIVEGNLFRIAGADAGAIGKPVPDPLSLPKGAGDQDVEQLAWQQLRTCFDPEIPVNVVDLGLVYGLELRPAGDGRRRLHVKLTLTAPGCGMGDVLVDDAMSKLKLIPTVAAVDIELVFEPPWNYSMMSLEAKLATGML